MAVWLVLAHGKPQRLCAGGCGCLCTASSGRGCGALPSPAAGAGCNCRHAASGTRSDAPLWSALLLPGPSTDWEHHAAPASALRVGPLSLQAGAHRLSFKLQPTGRREDRPVHSSCLQRLHLQQALLASSPCAVFLKAANGQASRAAAGQAWTASESCLPFSAGQKRSKFVSHIPDCCSAGKHLDESDLQPGDKHLAHVWLLLLL